MRNIGSLAALFFTLSQSISVHAGEINHIELIVIEQQGCVYCEKFNLEIAQAYPKTAEGKIAPLRRVDLYKPWPEDLASIEIERFTPTFILVQNQQEIARLRGYPGDEYFWFLLNEMLDKLDKPDQE